MIIVFGREREESVAAKFSLRAMALPLRICSKLLHRFNPVRTFVDVKVKWVRDPYLDFAVEREKDLKQAISLKNQILSDPSKSLPVSVTSLLKPHLNLCIPSSKFVQRYPSFFFLFQPGPGLPPRIKLTPRALSLHKEESTIQNSSTHRFDAANRLLKLLMLAGATKLPLCLIEKLKWDMGLPPNFVGTLLADFPDYFQLCDIKDPLTGKQELGLEILSWRKDLAISELEGRTLKFDWSGKKANDIAFPISFPRGFDLEKRVKEWVEQWQRLP